MSSKPIFYRLNDASSFSFSQRIWCVGVRSSCYVLFYSWSIYLKNINNEQIMNLNACKMREIWHPESFHNFSVLQ